MRLPALALFTRALRLGVRQKRSHLLRLAFAGLIFIAMASAEASSGRSGAPGLDFFRSIAWFNFAALTLAGVSWFATAVTEDKDEGTFDLLKLAGIGSLGLLLGRSTTRLVATLLILSVQFPFTFLAVTLGGVVPEQVFAMYVSLAAYAVLLANLGLLCSVVARGSAIASGLAVALVALALAGPRMVQTIWSHLVQTGTVDRTREPARTLDAAVSGLPELSTVFRISDVLNARFAGEVWSGHARSHLIAAAVLFGLSWWSLRYVTRASRSRPRRFGWPRGRTTGIRKPRRVWRRALLWKELHGSVGGPALQALKFAAYLGVPSVLARAAEWDLRTFSESLMLLMLLLIAAEASLYAALVFRSEVESRTLPMLALLPVSVGQIARAKAAAILVALAPGTCVFLVAATLFPAGFRTAVGGWLATPADWLLLVQFVVFLHVAAYLSLWVKWGALPLALLVVFASTYLLGGCCVFPLSLGLTGSLNPVGPGARWMGLVLPMILVAAPIVVWLQYAIAERLRVLAAR